MRAFRPRFDKTANEPCTRNRPAVTSAAVFQVRPIAAETEEIFVVHWHLPVLFARFFANVVKGIGELVVVGKDAGAIDAERNHYRPGQRGGIKDRVQLELAAGIRDRIRKDKTSF